MDESGHWHKPDNAVDELPESQGIQVRVRSHSTDRITRKSLEVCVREVNWNAVSVEKIQGLINALIALDKKSQLQIIHMSDNELEASRITIIVIGKTLSVEDFRAVALYILLHEIEPISLVVHKDLPADHGLFAIAAGMEIPVIKTLKVAIKWFLTQV